MTLHPDIALLAPMLLIVIRIGCAFAATPLMGGARTPVAFRLMLIAALAGTLAITLAASSRMAAATALSTMSVLGEALVGLSLAFAIDCAIAAFQFGGRVIDFQIGFGIASLFDPVTKAQAPLLGMALGLFGTTMFFGLDLHHQVVRALAWSLEAIPAGFAHPRSLPDSLVRMFGQVFVVGIELVAATMLLLLVLDVAIAVSSRVMPQMNAFIVTIPLKVFVGLVICIAALPGSIEMIGASFEHLLVIWQSAFG